MPDLMSTSGSESRPAPPTNKGELREGIISCFANIKSDGSLALFDQLYNAPNPGTCLRNGGMIGLPLSDRDAQAIVLTSHAAPFGKGEDTIVDTRVRKTWEISAADFELKNPAWQKFLDTVVSKVSSGLGVDAAGGRSFGRAI